MYHQQQPPPPPPQYDPRYDQPPQFQQQWQPHPQPHEEAGGGYMGEYPVHPEASSQPYQQYHQQPPGHYPHPHPHQYQYPPYQMMTMMPHMPPPVSKRERRHREMNERLDRLNREFMEAKDRIYHEKLAQINTQLSQLQESEDESYIVRVAELEMEREDVIYHAEAYRDYMVECAHAVYEQETKQCMEEYQAEKQSLQDKLLSSLQEKKRKLLEERDTFDLITDIGSPTSGADGSNNNNNDKFSAATRKTRVMLSRNAAREAEEAMAAAAASSGYGNRREKKKREKVPQLTYLLREMDVAEDMSFIRKSTAVTGKKMGKSKRQM